MCVYVCVESSDGKRVGCPTTSRAEHAAPPEPSTPRPPSRARRAPARPARPPQVWAPGAKFDGADFTNGVIDRAYFKGCSFRGAIFSNAVLSGSVFEESDMQDSDFTDAYLGDFDQRKLCKNPTLKGENPITGAPTRPSAGCPALKE